ncbi:MAG TPA: hypothetical protein VJH03_12035 [Blastocatellia bacterium]|nr:hypothetical protein [Blastocatellia bacterium]
MIMRGFIPGAVVNFHPARLFHSMEPTLYDPDFFIELCTLDVAEITEIHRRLVAHDDSLIDLKHVTLQLGQLKALPRSSLLRFLGYFGILESLLTHPPRQSDPYDSITRQVRKKLVLLNGRFSRPPDYAVFGGTPVETIWTRMYAYRSQIAHGGPARIEGDLEVLGNHKKALALLRATTKAVARQALFEPQLVRDLREC